MKKDLLNLKNSKSQSEIVSSVLLIMLVVVVAMIVFAFVVPFVKDRLSSGNCLDVAGKIEISSGYTCYNSSVMQVQIHVSDVKDLIEGFSIELGGASTNNYKIKNNTLVTGVRMCGGATKMELPPSDNTERTYIIQAATAPNIVKVYPILKGGKICDTSDTITSIENCYPSQVC